MKRLILYTGIAFGLTVLSLFLPYKTHDYCEGGLFDPLSVTEKNIHTYGLETFPGYVVMFMLIILSVIVLIKQNFGTSLAGFIIGLLSLPAMFVMGVAMVFNLNFGGGPCNIRMGIGFYLLCLVVLLYSFALLMNMVYFARRRKQSKYNIDKSNLIDDIL